MMEEKKLTPQLRFPEFTNNDQWKADTVQNIVTTKSPPKKLQSSEYLDEGVFPIIDQSQSFYCGYTNDQQAIINEDLPLVIFGDHTCALKMAREPFAQGADGIKILKSKAFIDPEYLYQYLTYNGVKQENYKRHYSKLKEKIVPYPEFESGEQQKIASCLSSLDELIAAHNDKLDALKEHKKGLLQNLFPQEGETVPKVRFPEFEDDGEWIETTLEQVADYENGKAHEKDIDENGDYIVVNSKFISTEGETVKYSDTAFCPANLGDILMVLSDVPNGKAIAKCFYVDEENRYSVNQRICRITATDCDSRFLFYIMDRNAYFLSFDDGVKQTNLRKSDVLEFPFRIPTDPVEQTKIASCLSALDELIMAQAEKIEQLKMHKKGLMQGLFPSAV